MSEQLQKRYQTGLTCQQGLKAPVPRRVLGVQLLARWKNEPEQQHGWLCKLVGSAFQDFVIACLPGQPAAEMLPVTAQLWVEVLADMNMNEEQDRGRLETGIRKLTRTLKEWPQIASLLEAIPNREHTPADRQTVQTRTVEEETIAREAMKAMREKGLI